MHTRHHDFLWKSPPGYSITSFSKYEDGNNTSLTTVYILRVKTGNNMNPIQSCSSLGILMLFAFYPRRCFKLIKITEQVKVNCLPFKQLFLIYIILF